MLQATCDVRVQDLLHGNRLCMTVTWKAPSSAQAANQALFFKHMSRTLNDYRNKITNY